MPRLEKPVKYEIFSAAFTIREGCVIKTSKNICRPNRFSWGAATHRGQWPPHSRGF